MSRFVKYSRWLAAAILVGWGLRELFLPEGEPGIGFRIVGALFFIVPAVGIVLLVRWGYATAIAVCAFNAWAGPHGPTSTFGKSAMVVTLALVLIWLSLPSVRRQFIDEDAKA
jgi:hypothetical protein